MAIIQKNEMKRIALGVVSEPTVDLQGDYIPVEDIEKACHDFNKSLQDAGFINKSLGKVVKVAVDKLLAGDKEVCIDLTEIMEEVQKGNTKLGDMHESWNGDVGDIVESYIAPVDFEIDGQKVLKGSWLMAVQFEPEAFEKVLSGEYTGWSIGGVGKRTPIPASE